MRFFSLLLLAFCLAAPPVAAQPQSVPSLTHNNVASFRFAQKDGGSALRKKPVPQSKDALLDNLYARLAATKDEEEANGILERIERQLNESGSATADLLMDRATLALIGGDQPLAVEILDRVLVIAPRWSQAWSRRGSLFILMGDRQRAMADLFQAVAIEPRHYAAWKMLGGLYFEQDDNKDALTAFRKALAINPSSSDLKEAVEKLALEVEGRPL